VLYDDKDLPKYSEVVAVEEDSQSQQVAVSPEAPPGYDSEPATSTTSCQHSDDTSPTLDSSHATSSQ